MVGKLPGSFGKLASSTKFYVWNAAIGCLPDSIGKLICLLTGFDGLVKREYSYRSFTSLLHLCFDEIKVFWS